MTLVEELARFVVSASWEDISQEAQAALKIRVLDSLGCAIGALNGEPVRYIRKQIDEFGGSEMCTLIGGGKTAPDRAALYNSALVRYLDFNDSYLSKGETCHPSDNLGAVLAYPIFRTYWRQWVIMWMHSSSPVVHSRLCRERLLRILLICVTATMSGFPPVVLLNVFSHSVQML